MALLLADIAGTFEVFAIPTRETLKKLDIEFRPCVIAGACNPPLAVDAVAERESA